MKSLHEASADELTLLRYWRISLALGLGVIGAVALLLEILARTAGSIESGAAGIWQVGKNIANNTVHIPLLVRTNQVVDDISTTADRIAGATARIERAVARDGKGGATL